MNKKHRYAFSVIWNPGWMSPKVYRNVNYVDSDLPIDEFCKKWNEDHKVWHERIHKIKETDSFLHDDDYEWFVS